MLSNSKRQISLSIGIILLAIIAALVIIRHKDNIKRLLRGEEKAITPKDRH